MGESDKRRMQVVTIENGQKLEGELAPTKLSPNNFLDQTKWGRRFFSKKAGGTTRNPFNTDWLETTRGNSNGTQTGFVPGEECRQ